jgi:hypothetical protein
MKVKMAIISPWKTLIFKMKEETIESQASGYYDIEDPYVLEIVKVPEGITYMPIPIVFAEMKNQTYHLNKEMVIIAPFDPPKELENIYVQNTSTIIQPQSNSGLII